MLIPFSDEIRCPHLPVITFLFFVMHMALLMVALDGNFLQEAGRLHESRLYEHCVEKGISHSSWQQGNWISFFTYWALDKSWLAFLANGMILLVMGPSLENRAGKLLFTLYYVGSAAVAGLVYSILPENTVSSVSSSGAIAGLLGAYAIQIDLQTRVRAICIWYDQDVSGLMLATFWFIAQAALLGHQVCESPTGSMALVCSGFLTGIVGGYLTREFTPNVVVARYGELVIVSRQEEALNVGQIAVGDVRFIVETDGDL